MSAVSNKRHLKAVSPQATFPAGVSPEDDARRQSAREPTARLRSGPGTPVETWNNDASIVVSPTLQRAPPERMNKGQTIRVQNNVQQVIGGLATLARAGDIDQAQAGAAERWYRDYVMGIVGARDPEARRSGRAPDIHVSMLARTAAVTRCRMVGDSIGLCGELRLKLLLIDELSFSAIAEKLLPGDVNGRKKVAAQMQLLLEQLEELYARFDRRRVEGGPR